MGNKVISSIIGIRCSKLNKKLSEKWWKRIILVQHFDRTVFEAAIAKFDNYINKMIKILLFFVKWESVIIASSVKVRVMAINVTSENISVISWRSVLLEEETGIPGENR